MFRCPILKPLSLNPKLSALLEVDWDTLMEACRESSNTDKLSLLLTEVVLDKCVSDNVFRWSDTCWDPCVADCMISLESVSDDIVISENWLLWVWLLPGEVSKLKLLSETFKTCILSSTYVTEGLWRRLAWISTWLITDKPLTVESEWFIVSLSCNDKTFWLSVSLMLLKVSISSDTSSLSL